MPFGILPSFSAMRSAFFVGVTAVLYAFSFNYGFIESVFVALDEFGAVSYEPESRSFGHNYRIAIGLSDCN